jgi:hypothetical protein
MFKKETAGLGYLVTFFTPYAMLLNNVVDVIDNVFAADGAYQYIMIVGKKKTHLLRVITDGAWRIMFCRKHIGKLQQSFLCLGG